MSTLYVPPGGLHWVLSYLGKWHAWPDKGRQTLCGRLNVEHLRQEAVTRISVPVPTPAGEENFCAYCAKKVGVVTAPACGDPTTAAWIVVLRMRLRRERIRVDDAALGQFAGLLAEMGSPDEVAAREVYDEVQLVLLKPTWNRTVKIKSLPHLKEALAKIPPKSGALARVANTVRIWRRITLGDLTTENFRPERVIEIMLQVPTPEPYIRHLNMRGLPHLAAMFHPNTLARAKKEPALRGLFGGSTEYWDKTVGQLNIVAD